MIPFKAPTHCDPRFLTLQSSKSDKESSVANRTGHISCHLNPSSSPFNHSMFLLETCGASHASSRVQPIDVAETWQFRGKKSVLDNAERGSKCIQCILCISAMLGRVRVPMKLFGHTEVCNKCTTHEKKWDGEMMGPFCVQNDGFCMLLFCRLRLHGKTRQLTSSNADNRRRLLAAGRVGGGFAAYPPMKSGDLPWAASKACFL